MGEQAARRYFITAERFDAAEALRLASSMPWPAPMRSTPRSTRSARRWSPTARTRYAKAKRPVREVAGRPIDDDLLADTAERIAAIRASDEGREGVRSFPGETHTSPASRPSLRTTRAFVLPLAGEGPGRGLALCQHDGVQTASRPRLTRGGTAALPDPVATQTGTGSDESAPRPAPILPLHHTGRDTMFNKIPIANRGEIACRVAATCRRLGIRTVAVYSDADADARHVAFCDEAVHIGGAAARDSYLRADHIIEVARATGARPSTPATASSPRTRASPSSRGRRFGLHRPAGLGHPRHGQQERGQAADGDRRRAAGARLPRRGPDPALLRREADRIGYPVLLKASAGGGGKGMRVVEAPEASRPRWLRSSARRWPASATSACWSRST